MRNDNFLGYIGDLDHPNKPPSLHAELPRHWSENVYFIRSHPDGPIKIGFAANPYSRLTKMQMMCPFPLVFVAFEAGSQSDEAQYHERFKAHRLHGEWFSPADEIMALADQIGLPPFPVIQAASQAQPKAPECFREWRERRRWRQPRGAHGRFISDNHWDGVPIDVMPRARG